MKICPFMSHMLGTEGSNVLEIDAASHGAHGHADGVVVLGYDDDGSVGVKTERKSRAASKSSREANPTASHLYCLRETCRFYRSGDGDCSFDAILEGVTRQAESAKPDGKDTTAAAVARELDKFWKFQTQSATELISSFGDVEKRQSESLSRLQKDVEKKLSALAYDEERDADHEERMNAIRDGIAEIKDTIDARNDGFETLTTTVSDLVVGFEDSLKELKKQWEQLSNRIASLEGVAPRMERVESNVARTVDNIDRLERNWAELMDVVRTERKKGDDGVAQARRREAMKFNNLGVTSFHNGDLKLAREQFQEAVKRDDSFAECFNNLGLVFTELGESDKAADAFMQAVKLNPELHAAYNNLGYVFYKQGSYERAVEMYNEALGRSSNNSSAYTNLGNAHYKLGNKQEARKAWEKALELDPTNDKAQRSLKSIDD